MSIHTQRMIRKIADLEKQIASFKTSELMIGTELGLSYPFDLGDITIEIKRLKTIEKAVKGE